MRTNILTLTVVAAMSLGGASFAATPAAKTHSAVVATHATVVAAATASGTIKKINAKGHFILLSDGWRYHVAKDFALSGFKVGEKVSVTYDVNGKHRVATAVAAG